MNVKWLRLNTSLLLDGHTIKASINVSNVSCKSFLFFDILKDFFPNLPNLGTQLIGMPLSKRT